MKIEQTERGIEISQTEEGEDLFESMHKLVKPILDKNPMLKELSSFVKVDFDGLNKALEGMCDCRCHDDDEVDYCGGCSGKHGVE